MRVIAFPPQDGLQIGQSHWSGAGPLDQAAIDSILAGVGKQGYAVHLDETDRLEKAQATIANGEVVGTPEPYEPTPPPEIWLHGSVSGGELNPLTGTRYFARGDSLTYSALLRAGQEPASVEVNTIPDTDLTEPLSGNWALELVHELGLDQFCPMVTMTAGAISGTVTVPDRLCDGLYTLPEDRLAMVGPYKLRLADAASFEFKVRS